MFKSLLIGAAVLSATVSIAVAPASAAPACRDAKGHFMKCAPAKPVRCKSANGKFAKCGTPGAKPI